MKPIELAKFLAACRGFWANYSRATPEEQGEMLNERNVMLLRMDTVIDIMENQHWLEKESEGKIVGLATAAEVMEFQLETQRNTKKA